VLGANAGLSDGEGVVQPDTGCTANRNTVWSKFSGGAGGLFRRRVVGDNLRTSGTSEASSLALARPAQQAHRQH
jgi:hypothetical protein